MPRLPVAARTAVIQRANGLCEYCQSPADYSPHPFSIEHIFPISAGGTSELDTLAYACQGCNNHKYNKTQGVDALTALEFALFNPRQDDGLPILVGLKGA
jgi:5-methylcytosine-specific restriction endonuclease McrA